MKLQTVRGTRDIFGAEAQLFREIADQFADIARIYDFQEMATPIFEFTQVFKRSLGDDTDIVNKEMYTFEDRSGDSLTLRPEGTASVARAIISNSLLRDLPLKLFYSGPMFRHERPQKGRYRQFNQFGVEMLGVSKPLADIEILAFARDFFESFNLQDKVQLELNTIGDQESRQNYKKALVEYFSKFQNELSEDSQTRLAKNPLRILDSKDEKDQKFVDGAPQFEDHLNEESKNFFDAVLNGLNTIGLSYKLNSRLVRGLDYYNHTVFEFTTTELGSQNAVLSGGRYDNLVKTMGGPDTPGVGWAAGTDRLALLIQNPRQSFQTVAVINTDASVENEALALLDKLRREKIPTQPIYTGNFSKQMKKADKRHCSHAVLIGAKEVESQKFTLKNLKSGDQQELELTALIEKLKAEYEV